MKVLLDKASWITKAGWIMTKLVSNYNFQQDFPLFKAKWHLRVTMFHQLRWIFSFYPWIYLFNVVTDILVFEENHIFQKYFGKAKTLSLYQIAKTKLGRWFAPFKALLSMNFSPCEKWSECYNSSSWKEQRPSSRKISLSLYKADVVALTSLNIWSRQKNATLCQNVKKVWWKIIAKNNVK